MIKVNNTYVDLDNGNISFNVSFTGKAKHDLFDKIQAEVLSSFGQKDINTLIKKIEGWKDID